MHKLLPCTNHAHASPREQPVPAGWRQGAIGQALQVWWRMMLPPGDICAFGPPGDMRGGELNPFCESPVSIVLVEMGIQTTR